MIDLMSDLWAFMKERTKFWLTPIILLMVLLMVLLGSFWVLLRAVRLHLSVIHYFDPLLIEVPEKKKY